MIKAKVTKEKGNYKKVVVKGHAYGSRNEEGHDLICSAVSALAYTTVYSVAELVGVKPIAEDGDGYFLLELPQNISEEQLKVQNTVVGTFEIGVREISLVYPKNVKLEIEEVESNA